MKNSTVRLQSGSRRVHSLVAVRRQQVEHRTLPCPGSTIRASGSQAASGRSLSDCLPPTSSVPSRWSSAELRTFPLLPRSLRPSCRVHLPLSPLQPSNCTLHISPLAASAVLNSAQATCFDLHGRAPHHPSSLISPYCSCL